MTNAKTLVNQFNIKDQICWFKALCMLSQNWALIEQNESDCGVIVFFP